MAAKIQEYSFEPLRELQSLRVISYLWLCYLGNICDIWNDEHNNDNIIANINNNSNHHFSPRRYLVGIKQPWLWWFSLGFDFIVIFESAPAINNEWSACLKSRLLTLLRGSRMRIISKQIMTDFRLIPAKNMSIDGRGSPKHQRASTILVESIPPTNKWANDDYNNNDNTYHNNDIQNV